MNRVIVGDTNNYPNNYPASDGERYTRVTIMSRVIVGVREYESKYFCTHTHTYTYTHARPHHKLKKQSHTENPFGNVHWRLLLDTFNVSVVPPP